MRNTKQVALLCPVLLLACWNSGKAAPPKEPANSWESPSRLALFMAQRIEHEESSSIALRDIAFAFAKAGEVKQALKVAQSVQNENYLELFSRGEVPTQIGIALALAENGEFKQSFELVNEIDVVSDKAIALSRLTSVFVNVGNKDRALEIWKQALETAQTIEQADINKTVQWDIAISLAMAGKDKQALDLVQEIGDANDKSLDQGLISWTLAEAGYIERALQLARQIEDGERRIYALANIAPSIAKSGDLEQALKLVQRFEMTGYTESALKGIALVLANKGDLKRALQVAQKIKNPEDKDFALSGIASVLAKEGNTEQALELAEKIENSYDKASAQNDIAVALAQMGEIKRALELSRKIEHPNPKTNTWRLRRNIAVALSQAGDFSHAVEVAETIADAVYKEHTLFDIAMTLATEPILDNDRETPIRPMMLRYSAGAGSRFTIDLRKKAPFIGGAMKKAFNAKEKEAAQRIVETTPKE